MTAPPDALLEKAIEHHRAGQLGDAEIIYRQILSQNPNHPDAMHLLGMVAFQAGNANAGIELIRRAIAIGPQNPMYFSNLGNILREAGRFDEAINCCQNAIILKPDYAEPYVNLGIALRGKGLLEQATESLKHAIQLNSKNAVAFNNLGNIYDEQERYEDAVTAYRRAIELEPDYPEAHQNCALALLQLGRIPEGWHEFEWRKKMPEAQQKREFRQPQWDGRPLNGGRILLHAEQGFGDGIQFVRFASEVTARGGRVILECPPLLKRLLSRFPNIEQCLAVGETLPDFGVHCSLMTLPSVLQTDLASIPGQIPYLTPDPAIADAWKSKLGPSDGRFRVGLVWAGQPKHKNDQNRSMKLSELAGLSRLSNTSLYSLQKGDWPSASNRDGGGLNLIDLTNHLSDFAETAGLISQLDLVIGVDTAVMHLAGAMGKPAWIMLPYVADWRWFLHRDDSPWYPTVRLFRQEKKGDWSSVSAEIARALVDATAAATISPSR